MRTDLIKLWLTVALAGVLAVPTVSEFRATTPGDPGPAATDIGALLFQAKGCSGCHTVAGVAESGSMGPSLTHLNRVAAERITGMDAVSYVTQSIRDPRAFTVPNFGPNVMPTLQVSDAEMESLVAFLLTER